jgi:type II secretory pathway component PulF
MPRYQYKAINQNQQPVSGELEADSLHSAQEQLTHEGLVEITLQMRNAGDHSPSERSDDEAADVVFSDENVEELGEAFASLTRAGLPLEAGLRMMAEEHPSPRVSRALLSLSEQLQAGKTWEEISASSSRQFPPVLSELFQLKLPPERLSIIISRYLVIQQASLRRSRKIWAGLLYSQIILAALLFATVFILAKIVPKFKEIFVGFDTELPSLSMFVMTLGDFASQYWMWLIYLLLGLTVLRVFGARSIQRLRQQFIHHIPFSGKAFRANTLSTFSHLLGELVEHQVPMDVAVKLAASGSGNLTLEDESLEIARDLNRGESLSVAATPCLTIPSNLLMAFHWASRPESFQQNLESMGEVYGRQADDGASLLPVVIEPFLLFMTLFVVGFFVMALFTPLIKLLNDLS